MNIVMLDTSISLDTRFANTGALSLERFNKIGKVTVYPSLNGVDLVEAVKDADVIIGGHGMVPEVLDHAPNVKYIGLMSTGYDNLNLDYMKKRGIVVTNVPTYGTEMVAQYAITLLLEICGRVGHHDAEVRKGRWKSCREFCFWDYPIIELSGKTMGIVGFGRIGKAAAHIAQAFGMKVLYNDKYRAPELESETCQYAELDELYAKADVVELHCPLFPETKGMINKDTIAKMKDGVIIINNSRGPLVVDQDLADALTSGKVYAAGLDVVSQEPIEDDNPLLKAPNCYITPHISWVSVEARARKLNTVYENLEAFLEGHPQNTVY